MDVRIYDNGGKTIDRYTVIIDDDFYSMSELQSPQGVNMYGGNFADGNIEGEHLGERVSISNLPTPVFDAIIGRMREYKD